MTEDQKVRIMEWAAAAERCLWHAQNKPAAEAFWRGHAANASVNAFHIAATRGREE